MLWLLLSILLSITHDNSSKVAFDRMKGNVVGSLVGTLRLSLAKPGKSDYDLSRRRGHDHNLLVLEADWRRRTALVAFIIVVLYEEAHSGWEGAVYRVASVIVGCFIGLVINYVFRRKSR